MPQLRNIIVNVTDEKGNSLEEWGCQVLQSQSKVSAYIKSTTDMPFRVSVQPLIPYIAPDVAATKNSSSRHTRSSSSDDHSRRRSESDWTYKHKGLVSSSPLRARNHQEWPSPPDFDFLASLYIDGRKKPERRTIVYLDPRNPDFEVPHGKVRFKSRYVQDRNGGMKAHAWVFKDVGIEASFGKLLVSKHEQEDRDLEEPVEDALVKGLNSTILDAEAGSYTQATAKVGQIIVTLQRVKLGKKSLDLDYRPKHREGEEDDFDMDDIERDITHTTGLAYIETLPRQATHVIDYHPYEYGEGPYATFQFFYRSQESLEKFNFPNFPRKAPTAQYTGCGRMNREMASKTIPLSISRGVYNHTKVGKAKGKAFEENVRDKGFGDIKPEYAFTDGYRDPTAMALKGKCSQNSSETRTLAVPSGEHVNNPTRRRERRKAHFPGRIAIVESHLSASSPKEYEKREDSSTTPSSATSTESLYLPSQMLIKDMATGSSYSPPDSIGEYMAINSSLPNESHAPVHSNSCSMKENLPSDLHLHLSHHLPKPRDTISAMPRPPTPHPAGSFNPGQDMTTDTLAVLSKQPGDDAYRRTGQASDADDERDESDLEGQLANDKENQDPDDPDDFWSADKDDEGLHGQLEAVRISPRKRPHEDDENAEDDTKGNGENAAPNSLREEGAKDVVQGDDGPLVGNRQRRNALSIEDTKAIEEISRVKRLKIVAEAALDKEEELAVAPMPEL